jgi:hypothetical protein
MAAAARPGPNDARVPCPLCGGLIHPIAGKCKHCKAELAEYRAARPAASTPLPALHQSATAAPAVSNGHAPSAPIAHAVTLPAAAQTVLPPRPTAHAQAAPAAPGSAWRSWPVVVIVVAVMAIVAAVVLMVWPPHRAEGGKRVLQPPPAPERMDTQTPPVVPKIDTPAPHAGAQNSPSAPNPPAGRGGTGAPSNDSADATDPNSAVLGGQDPGTQIDPSGGSDDDLDAIDPPTNQAGPRNRGRSGRALTNFNGALGLAMTARLCRKLARCGSTDDALQPLCDAIAGFPPDPPPGCPAAERCLRHIDAMGCTSQPDALQMGMMLMRFPDCAEAARC